MGGGRHQGVNDYFDERNGRTTDSSEQGSSKSQPPAGHKSHCTMLLTVRGGGEESVLLTIFWPYVKLLGYNFLLLF